VADDVKQLLVRVSATTELLRSNLALAEREINKFANTAEQATGRADNAFKRVGATAGSQRAGMQQLSMQIGDVATQFAMGTKPMQIFAQQGGQVFQAIQLMAGGGSRFAAFLGGPWGLALSAAAIAVTPFIGRLFEAEDALDNVGDAATTAMQKVRQALAQTSVFTDAATENTRKIISGMGDVARIDRELLVAKRNVEVLQSSPGGAYGLSDAYGRVRALEAQRASARAGITSAQNNIEELRGLQVVAMRQDALSSPRTGGGGRTRRPRSVGGGRSGMSAAERAAAASAKVAESQRIEAGNWGVDREREVRDNINAFIEEEARVGMEVFNRRIEYELEQRIDMLEKLRQVEERQIGYLSGVFENAFRGGAKAIWGDFKDMGLAVISQLLARFAVARIGGKGFNFGDALGTTLTSILGFADGGRPPVGRASMVGERGPELFIPDVAGTVYPNGTGPGGGGLSVTINAPGATAETVAMIRREIASAFGPMVSAATSNTMREMSRRRLA